MIKNFFPNKSSKIVNKDKYNKPRTRNNTKGHINHETTTKKNCQR